MTHHSFQLLAKLLAAEFERRNMAFHLESLRRFCVAPPTQQVGDEWSQETVTEWLALFGIAPFARKYPLRPSGSSCPKCRTTAVKAEVVTLFNGGSKRSCLTCGTPWVELEAGHPRTRSG